MADLQIKSRKVRKCNHVKLSLSGSLEASNAALFWESMNQILKDRPGARITVDMSDLLFIASCGWALLLAGSHSASTANGALAVAGMLPAVRRVYQRLHLEKHLASMD